MKVEPRTAAILVFSWLLSCLVAWSWGGYSSEEGSQSTEHAGGSVTRPGFQTGASGADAAANRRAALSHARTVNRFLSFTKSLNEQELARLLPEISEQMDASQVEEALARLLKEVRPGPARRLARFELIDRWAQLDPMAAFANIDAMETSPLRDDLKKRGIQAWASIDPGAAHSWIETQDSQDLPKEALRSIWKGIADSKDLEATLAFIPSLGPGSNQYSEPHEIWDIYMTLHTLYEKDDKTVRAWVETLPPGEVRNRALHSMIDQWARHDAPAARDWIEEHADPSNRREAYVELAESWGRHDPQAAVDWAAGLPPNTDGLRQVYERLFTRFIQYDYETAASYLASQQPSPTMDTAFEVYIDRVKGIDPAASMEWAVAITDEARRQAAMSSVAGIWRTRDREALERFVRESELPEGQRNSLLGR